MKAKIDSGRLAVLPHDIPPLPKGWLNGFDAAVLYTIAKQMGEGQNILEVGSWIGRSSCVISYGLRTAQPTAIGYDIVDYGITGADEWARRFGSDLFADRQARVHAEAIMFPGGSGALLKQNLVDRNLSRFVRLIVLGDVNDFQVNRRYDFIFCDATHGEAEIRKNIPILKGLLQNEFILVCDDIITDEDAVLVHALAGSSTYYLTHENDAHSKFGVFVSDGFGQLFS